MRAAGIQAASTDGGYGSRRRRSGARRSGALALTMALAFLLVGGQLVRLALRAQNEPTSTMSQAVPTSYARPDIVDRNGRLLATDVEVHSLYADPALVIDRDEVAERLARVLPDIDEAEVRRLLADPLRRFVWLRRGLPPKVAQAVHDLGLPGLGFRTELRRAYPAGRLAGHALGAVNIDNKGLSGIERYIDERIGVEPVHGATRSDRAAVRLSLDLGVQHAIEDELAQAMGRYGAKAAAGIVLDAQTGEIVAMQSLPSVDPSRPAEVADPSRPDRVQGSVYELGSILKLFTVAMALDAGTATTATMLDVREPLSAGRFAIKDPHPAGRPLSVAEVFTRSSNVGSAMLALELGAERQKAFLARIGLVDPLRTEAGPVAPPLVPQSWGRAETITVAYGHGIALAPVQLAAAAAGLVNGGRAVTPTLVRYIPPIEGGAPRRRVISTDTSRALATLMRLNVTDKGATGRRAEAPGYAVGGKTGTAEIPGPGGYRETAVIASFLAAFPSDAPSHVALVALFEPRPVAETKGQITAGHNAAPSVARIVSRIAPLLGIAPRTAEPAPADAATGDPEVFDAPTSAKY